MSTTLRILHLEDNPTDSELIGSLLSADGLVCTLHRVQTREEFIETLQRGGWDLILGDVSLPLFNGIEALAIARNLCPQVPFIFVTGAVGEETAIETVKSGARDYVLKQRLSRLVPAVHRALREAEERTKRQRAEEALRRSEHRLRTILNSEPACVAVVGQNGLVQDMNLAGVTMVEAPSRSDVLDRPIVSFVAVEDRDAFVRMQDDVLNGDSRTLQFRLTTLAGRLRWIDAHAVPFRDALTESVSILIVARDVTESRKMEAQLQQALKMEAVGRLAGGVAHDFNNMLTGIAGHTDLLLRQLPADSRLRRHADEIKKSCARCAALTNQLLTFSRKQVWQPRALNVAAAVGDLEGMLRPLIGEDVILRIGCNHSPLYIKADPNQIELIIMNLAVNARDAMPDGGELTIDVSPVTLPEAAPWADGNRSRSYVTLSVRDTGVGMDPHTMSRIFEPFFTTKEKGKGTGLGLSTVYGIVRESGGYIEVESTIGQGSLFQIFFPRIDQAPESMSFPTSTAGPAARPRTILIVEDDAMVRSVIREVLVAKGHCILEAGHGQEAMALCETHGAPIDLLLTDVVMPHLGGRELAQRLRSRYPRLKVLFTSGYMDDAVLRREISEGMAFLPKPFTPAVLEEKVREVLEGAS